MADNVVKFPYSASRRVHSKKPRRSKNGTPEERAAKVAALEAAPADIVPMSHVRAQARSEVDGRKLRGSPLRDYIGAISFGATVVGEMHTAGLKGKPLAEIQSKIRKEWLETFELRGSSAVDGGHRDRPGDEHPEGVRVGNFRLSGKFTGPRPGTTCPKFSD
jgi:hypothetical protein